MNSARIARLGLIGWGLAVAFITLNRTDPLSSNVPTVARPVSEVTGVPEPDVISFLYALEWPANLLMFVPLGVLLPLAFGFRLWTVAGLGLAVTLGIELSQALLFGTRDASAWDVLANFSGTLLGYPLGRWLVGAIPRQHRLDGAQH